MCVCRLYLSNDRGVGNRNQIKYDRSKKKIKTKRVVVRRKKSRQEKSQAHWGIELNAAEDDDDHVASIEANEKMLREGTSN